MLAFETTDVVFCFSCRLLLVIKKDVEKQSLLSPLVRLLRWASIAEMLDDHIDALDSAWRTFDVRASASSWYTSYFVAHSVSADCVLDRASEERETAGVIRPSLTSAFLF